MSNAVATKWIVDGRTQLLTISVDFDGRGVQITTPDGETIFGNGFNGLAGETLEGLIDALDQAREALEA